MNRLLLLGAGFSYNWGAPLADGLFSSLMGRPQITSVADLPRLLRKYKDEGGFESALEVVQRDFKISPNAHNRERLDKFQGAITEVFGEINSILLQRNFEFANSREHQIASLFVHFDAIFSLNQDLLLDAHYANENVSLLSNQRWNGPDIPGMKPDTNDFNGVPTNSPHLPSRASYTWRPKERAEFSLSPRLQPYFKLHGSSNWKAQTENRLMIVGGGKSEAIQEHEILKWYHQEFRTYLAKPETRLVVIGYGFADHHINRPIYDQVEKQNLKLFIVDPRGSIVVNKLKREGRAAIIARDPLEDIVEGEAKRPLPQIFGGSNMELTNLKRFLEI